MAICMPSMRGVFRPHVAVGVTWNPSDTSGPLTLSNGNLTASGGALPAQVRATVSASSGQLYWEVRLDTIPVGSNPYVGIRPSANTLTGNGPFDSGGDYGCFVRSLADGHQDYVPGSNGAAVGPTVVSGDVYIQAADFGASKYWIGRNGTWDSGDPAAGTGGITISAGTWAPWVSVENVTVTGHFAASSWTYSAPSGFSEFTHP